MFSSVDKNHEMIFGSYKKLKKYYNYNKNFVLVREKIAEFEYDKDRFDTSIDELSKLLENPTKYSCLIDKWLEAIGVYVLPKKITRTERKSEVIREIGIESTVVSKVNFFIDAPIEIHILDTLWTTLIGRNTYDKVSSSGAYGNILNSDVIYDDKATFESSINYTKSSLFKNYYYQYCAWKNNAIKEVEKANKNGKSTVLISLDVKGYFYSVNWDFNELDKYVDAETLEKFAELTLIIEKVYRAYTNVLSMYRKSCHHHNASVLPIGLFSSMHLSNLYLLEYDNYVKKLKNVIYYGRYVDDILILVDKSEYKSISDSKMFEHALMDSSAPLLDVSAGNHCLYGCDELIIQKDKVKLFYFNRAHSESLIRKIKETQIIPSNCNVIPDYKIDITDFEEAAYMISNLSSSTKIRDIGHMQIDKNSLGKHMSQIVQLYRHRENAMTNADKRKLQEEGKMILRFFKGANAVDFYSNWINAFYFFIVTRKGVSTNVNNWKKLNDNILNSIKALRLGKIEFVVDNSAVKEKMKSSLQAFLKVSVATALALNLHFLNNEEPVLDLAKKIRAANMFNQYLQKYPLVNYSDLLPDDIDLTDMSIETFNNYSKHITKNRKVDLSPRFIYLEELFYFSFLCSAINGGNFFSAKVDEKLENIRRFFYRVNNITDFGKKLPIEIENQNYLEQYYVQKVRIKTKKYNKIRAAVANIDISIKQCCSGLDTKYDQKPSFAILVQMMEEVYNSRKGDAIDFLILPEFYLPISWIQDVMAFVRKSGITVITGLQYITNSKDSSKYAHNNIAVFIPTLQGKYHGASMIIREKNDYAPQEKQLLALNGYRCNDQERPMYNVFDYGNVRFGTFLCYEFTDIVARGLYKNKIDMLFTPEYNKDTSYFSSIIESMVRDLHIFIAQANVSSFGDSRVTGPYDRNNRNILQIKGGENDNLVIATIELEEVIKEQTRQMKEIEGIFEKCDKLSKKNKIGELRKAMRHTNPKISKLSARYNRYE